MDTVRAAELVSQRGFIYEAAMRDVQENDEMRKEDLRRIMGQAPNFISDFIARAAILFSQRGVVHKEAMRDAQGKDEMRKQDLSRIKGQASKFINEGKVWNREVLVARLNSIVEGTGHFVCLLGGKSTGKSLVLDDLANRHRGKVFVVDLRLYGSILGGLLRVFLSILSPKTFYTIVADIIAEAVIGMVYSLPPTLQDFTEKIASAGEVVQEITGAEVENVSRALVNLLRAMHRTKDDRAGPLRIVLDAMIRELGAVTIVVDEANIAFDIKPDAGLDHIKETKAALEFFTQFTKQRKRGNVILVSTEHAFPYDLSRKGLGFNLANFSRFLYAGEVAPKDMHQLLVKEWSVGRHLALALLAHYGGHVWETYLALDMLRYSKNEASSVGLDPLKSTHVQECLAWRPEEQAAFQRRRMRQVLGRLAEQGFAPISDPEDKVAEVISQNNVGGVVKADSLVVGLPREIWGAAKYGLVPATQSMRLTIADLLVSEAPSTSDVEATEP